jgi:ATP-dependent helicase/DNAse subunit B
VPRPRTGIVVERLGVTAFRDYIACPYRFYLKHIEKLTSVADLDGELTAATFGTLIHSALNHWAASDAKDATNPADVRRVVEGAFDAAAAEMFDDQPLPAVKLQLEQARLRLKAFAEWQAEHRRVGWQLRHHEVGVSRDLPLVNGRTLAIKGQIDRIDYHPDRDQWLIIDYKTGDAGMGPEEVHLASGEWVDLQLPLYRWLAASLNIPGEPTVAYVTLGKEPPKEASAIFRPAEWSTALWAQAQWKIYRIAEDVAAGVFWPPAKEPPRYDDFASITQEGVFGREVLL